MCFYFRGHTDKVHLFSCLLFSIDELCIGLERNAFTMFTVRQLDFVMSCDWLAWFHYFCIHWCCIYVHVWYGESLVLHSRKKLDVLLCMLSVFHLSLYICFPDLVVSSTSVNDNILHQELSNYYTFAWHFETDIRSLIYHVYSCFFLLTYHAYELTMSEEQNWLCKYLTSVYLLPC